jgi:HD-GYP domain-containing protein (c-di-GMP phosphodiesterase class II)
MIDSPRPGLKAPAYLVYHGAGVDPEKFGLRREQCRPADELFAIRRRHRRTRAAVLLLDAAMVARGKELRRLPRPFVLITTDAASERAFSERADLSSVGVTEATALKQLLAVAGKLATTRELAARRQRLLARADHEALELSRIGMALMLEHDSESLLHQIVDQGKQLTESDAGALLLIETDENGARYLRPALYEVDSLPGLELWTDKIPVDDSSIVGHAARTKTPVVLADSYDVPDDALFSKNPAFDKRVGYRSRSMLIVPMVDHVDRLIGELVFVNRKSKRGARITSEASADRYVLPYTQRQVRLARSLASQAAVSIENAQLYLRIEQTLEGVVKAAVSAIDQRDPSTAGHSIRVATLAVDLAAAVGRSDRGAYRETRFTHRQLRELYFAALLHDFGKVAVHEDVLLKAKKLPPLLAAQVEHRFELIRLSMELEHDRALARAACSAADDGGVARLDADLARSLEKLGRMRQTVRAANVPSLLAPATLADLQEIAQQTFTLLDGTVTTYLTADELHYLRIERGTLDERERSEVESHAQETYRFLAHIPWTDDLKDLVTYAYGHHEKINGAGYPQGLKGDEIPVQTRLITIADMFDALTESDRVYRPGIPTNAAIDIMAADARSGLIDQDLLEILVESRAYQRIVNEDWHRFWHTSMDEHDPLPRSNWGVAPPNDVASEQSA